MCTIEVEGMPEFFALHIGILPSSWIYDLTKLVAPLLSPQVICDFKILLVIYINIHIISSQRPTLSWTNLFWSDFDNGRFMLPSWEGMWKWIPILDSVCVFVLHRLDCNVFVDIDQSNG